MAHFVVIVAARLYLYSAWRQPLRTVAHEIQPVADNGCGWGMAWRRLYVCGLGLAHGMALVVQKAFSPLVSRLRAPRQVWIATTFVFVTVMWLPFRCVSLADTAVMFCRIFTDFRPEVIEAFVRERAVWTLMLIAAYVLIFLPDRMSEWAERRFVGMRWFGKLLLLCLLLQLIIEISAAYVAPFIYAGF